MILMTRNSSINLNLFLKPWYYKCNPLFMFAHGMDFQKGEGGPLFSWRTLCFSDSVSNARRKTVLPGRLCPLPAHLPEDTGALLFSYTPSCATAALPALAWSSF